MSYLLDNNVLTTLHTAITAGSTSIVIDAATAPNKSPPAPTAGNIATLTLVDTVVSPTKIEIVTYTTSTNNGDGTYTLTGVTRGTEGTTAQSFAAGASVFNAITAATFAAATSPGTNTLLQFCGDGSDGDAMVSTSISLVRDTYYRNLTLAVGGSINANGFAVYVSGVLDLTAASAAAIHGIAGASGAGTAGGAGAQTVTVPCGFPGGAAGASSAGGGNPGGVGSAAPGGTNGGIGGYGGFAPAGAGLGSGGFGGLGIYVDVKRPGADFRYTNGAAEYWIGGGTGGGGGGGGKTGGLGGGGGGGGGACVVYAATIATSASTPAGVIQGGAGGNGAGASGTSSTAGGAGGGGGSGPVVVGYGNRIGPVVSGGIKTQGGSAGVIAGGGFAAYAGGAGVIHVYNLLTGTGSTTPQLGGSNGSGQAGAVNSANL